MRDQLPAWVDVQRLTPGYQPGGSLCLSDREDWPAGEASVTLELEVVQAPTGRPKMCGRLHGETEMVCQRCLETMPVEWDCEFALELVTREADAQRMENAVDVYVAEDGRVHIQDLVRDESVLALPMTARHPDGECEPPGKTSTE